MTWLLTDTGFNLAFFLTLFVLSTIILIYFLFSYSIQRRALLSEIPIAAGVGLLLSQLGFLRLAPPSSLQPAAAADGPPADVSFEEHGAYRFLELLSILVISLQLMSSGLNTSRAFLHDRAARITVATLLSVVLLCMSLLNGAFIYALFHQHLTWWQCFCVGAATSPTDPVLASALVRGKFARRMLSTDVRYTLSTESALNDGLAFPLVYLAIVFMEPSTSTGRAIGQWFYEAWLWSVLLPVVVGGLIGWYLALLIHFAVSRGHANREDALLPLSTALTLMLMSAFELLGSNAFLAIISCGLAMVWQIGKDFIHVYGEEDLQKIAESLDLIVAVAFFLLLPAFFDFSIWSEIGFAPLIGWTVLMLFFRRVPVALAAYGAGWLPSLTSWREALFVGWLAPIGSASSYYALFIARHAEHNDDVSRPGRPSAAPTIMFQMCMFAIFCSLIIHGLGGPLTACVFRRFQEPVYRQEELEHKQRRHRQRQQRQSEGGEESANHTATDGPAEHKTPV